MSIKSIRVDTSTQRLCKWVWNNKCNHLLSLKKVNKQLVCNLSCCDNAIWSVFIYWPLGGREALEDEETLKCKS